MNSGACSLLFCGDIEIQSSSELETKELVMYEVVREYHQDDTVC